MLLNGVEVVQLSQMRMSYLAERHKVVSLNVANADTPGWRTQDLKPFEAALDSAAAKAAQPSRTDPMHLASLEGEVRFAEDRKAEGWEMAPSGNSVILEQEMIKASKIAADYDLTSLVLGKSGQMMRTAISFRG